METCIDELTGLGGARHTQAREADAERRVEKNGETARAYARPEKHVTATWPLTATAALANPCHSRCPQSGLNTRLVEGGLFANLFTGRRGLATSSPPQFGHFPCSTLATQSAQNVHSNEQIRASPESGGRSLSQHSQPGRSSSIMVSCLCV